MATEGFEMEAADQVAWFRSNQRAHYSLFAAFLAFNILSVIGGKFLANRRRFKDSRAAAQAQHSVAQLAHAALSVGAAAYAFSHRPSVFTSSCGDTLFCFNALSFNFLDIHAGYLFYQWIFYYNNHEIIKPRFNLQGAYRTLLVAGYSLSRAHPCALTLDVLPWYELLAVGDGAEALLDLSLALGAPNHVRLNRLLTLVITSFARAVGAVAIAFRSWWWLSSRGIMQKDMPGGKAPLNAAYCVIFLGGGFVVATIYLNWFRKAVDLMRRTEVAIAEQRMAQRNGAKAVVKSSGPAKKKGKGRVAK